MILAIALSAIVARQAVAQASPAPVPRADSGAPPRNEIFGRGLLFPSPVASVEEPSLRNSLLVTRGPDPFRTLIGLTEEGAQISLYRRNGRVRGDGVELSIEASASAQFDLLGAKWTLLNADYTFSYPMTWRRRRNAIRFRALHRSSHLGDRYLLLRRRPRTFDSTGFRRESLELLYAHTFGDSARSLVLYGGGAHAYSVTPRAMRREELRMGGDNSHRFYQFGGAARASWVTGAEITSTQDRGWNPGISVRTGVEIAPLRGEMPGGRRYRALLEYYQGPSPYGNFSREDKLHYVGISCIVIP